ncbi:UDP-glucose 4-epimerase, partial [Mesorhizobium sp. M7A.F.Ca.US.001.04.1.1]
GYVDDIVEGLERYFWRDGISHRGPLNIGNDHEVSVLRIAEFVRSLVPGSRIEHHPPAPQDPTNRRPDLTSARHVLPGWEARTSYQEGIGRTFDWFRQRIAAGTVAAPTA